MTVTFAVESPPAPPSPFECFSIEILDDSVLEGNQEFTVTITDTSDNAPINAMSSTTTVTIIDNEGLKLTHIGLYKCTNTYNQTEYFLVYLHSHIIIVASQTRSCNYILDVSCMVCLHAEYCVMLTVFSAEGTIVMAIARNVSEGEVFNTCFTVISTATILGFDLSIDLATSTGKAGIVCHYLH